MISLIFPNPQNTQESVNKKIMMKMSKTRSVKLRSGGGWSIEIQAYLKNLAKEVLSYFRYDLVSNFNFTNP